MKSSTSMLPAESEDEIWQRKNINFYVIDAWKIAEEVGLGTRINMVMQAAFFKLTNVIPIDKAVNYLKEGIEKTYRQKGTEHRRHELCCGRSGHRRADPQDRRSGRLERLQKIRREKYVELPEFIEDILIPMNTQEGDDLPVSAFDGIEDGTFPSGTAAYEKRGVAAIPA